VFALSIIVLLLFRPQGLITRRFATVKASAGRRPKVLQ
jgi:hypothetical protein